MRILFPAHQAAAFGGIGTVARGVADHVPRVLGQAHEFVAVSPGAGSRHRGLDSRGAASRLWFEQVSLARAARSFDLIHLCDLRPLVLSGTPFLITVHDVFFLDHPEWTPAPVRRYKASMLRLALAKRPAAVLCDSEFTRARLLAHHPRAAERGVVRVIYPGVEESRTSWEPDTERPYLLTVSTIEPRKNHLGLLAAFRRARAAGLELRWLIAGSHGRLSEPILAQLRDEPGVEVLGAVPQAALERLYAGASIVATPSFVEGFGYPPLEAMARGVPTISAASSSLPEVVAGAGLLVGPDDVDGWAESLSRLAADADERDRLSAAGRRRAADFAWDRAAREIADTYERLAA